MNLAAGLPLLGIISDGRHPIDPCIRFIHQPVVKQEEGGGGGGERRRKKVGGGAAISIHPHPIDCCCY